MKIVPLKKHCIIEASGKDVFEFLQSMMTIDVYSLAPTEALWGGFLSPQGKYLYDVFLYYQGDEKILIEIASIKAHSFIEYLQKYILRRQVTLKVNDDCQILVLWNEPADEWGFEDIDENKQNIDIHPVWFEKYQIVPDPRKAELGYRWIGLREKADNFMHSYGTNISPLEDYYAWRIKQAICEPTEDMVGLEFFFSEIRADEMNGIDYKKGCYIGQEVTARIKHKGELKKQVIPVRVMGNPDLPATLQTDLQDIGTLVAYNGSYGLAYVRIDRWEKAIETLRSITTGTSIISRIAS